MIIKLSITDYWNEYYESSEVPKVGYWIVLLGSVITVLFGALLVNRWFLLLIPVCFLVPRLIHASGAVMYVASIAIQRTPLFEYEIDVDVNEIIAVDLGSNKKYRIGKDELTEKMDFPSLVRYRSDQGNTYLFPKRINGIDILILKIDEMRLLV